MRYVLSALILAVLVLPAAAQSDEDAYYRDIYPDTWVATDALGRTMPSQEDVGAVKDDQRRVTGIFYITWHSDVHHRGDGPYKLDVTRILEQDPSARLDGNHPLWVGPSYHWAEPEMGYFLSKDEYVIRKDMSMLADAGVDVLIMDVTNAVRYWDEWSVVFPTMQKMKAEGNKVPKFCFWAFNGPVITVVQELYDRVYKEEKYKDLWFYWDGKPLLLYNGTPDFDATGRGPIKHPNPNYEPAAATDLNHPHYGEPYFAREFLSDYTEEIREFFTLRTMWWGYYEWAGGRFVGTEGNWSFGYDLGNPQVAALSPEELVAPYNGKPEQAAVTPAQHATTMIGKCWTREHGQPELDKYDLPVPTYVPWLGQTVDNPEAYGIYFQARWEEALAVDPQFIYLNDWNEWTAGKYAAPEDNPTRFMGRESNFFFVDQYNSEFTRAIHPMKDGYTDNYYMQMAQNIRRYKGVRPIPRLEGRNEITVDGAFDDWQAVEVEYRDTIGDTFHRDYPGYGGEHYVNTSGRNDIITSKVAVDGETVHFYAETNKALTPHTDPNWMLLLIDADRNHDTGWHGYDFLVNKLPESETATSLMRWDAEGETWMPESAVEMAYAGRRLELAIPMEMLGLQGEAFTFDFHWADNPADLETPISWCVNGDSAPNRRFNYRCIWKADTEGA